MRTLKISRNIVLLCLVSFLQSCIYETDQVSKVDLRNQLRGIKWISLYQ